MAGSGDKLVSCRSLCCRRVERVRSATAVSASAMPTVVTSAASHGSAVSPAPRAIAALPSHAPSALARLNAPMLRLEARLGASLAWRRIHSCNGATVANIARPSRPVHSTTDQRACCAKPNTTSTAASAASVPSNAPDRRRSASRPPSGLPIAMPTPNTSSTGETIASPKPATRVSSGSM